MKIFTGKTISTNMAKTAKVAVTRIVVHPIYKKRFKRTKYYHIQDDLGTGPGDIMKFVATRPYSKTKKWKIVEIVDKKAKL